MDEKWKKPSMEELTTKLFPLMQGENEKTNRSQLKHRLNILQAWFGDLSSTTPEALRDASILEIGCGQGDMTVPLAHFAGTVDAIDPAPLTYGSPLTLGQAQERVSKYFDITSGEYASGKIHWIQDDPIEYISNPKSPFDVDVVVLAHSLFYLPSEDYLAKLLQKCRSVCHYKSAGELKLVIAEWGMRASNPAAEAHVLAVKAQEANPLPDGNVRVVVTPERIKEIAASSGWKLVREHWIEAPDLDDGHWEVGCARETKREGQELPLLKDMERAVERLEGGRAAAMDVWTAVFTL